MGKPDERQPRYDGAKVITGDITTEKITVSRTYEDGRVDITERQKYPRDHDVDHIVLDEKVEETPKEDRRKVTDRLQMKGATTTREDVTDILRTDVRDIERIDVRGKEKKYFEPKKPEERFLPDTERLDYQRKASV